MNSINTTELVSMVRFYADIENATERFTDDKVKRELDYGMARYWNLLQKRLTWQQVTLYEFTTTDGTATYTVPAHGRTVSVERKVGDKYRPIHRAELFTSDNNSFSKYQLEYSEYVTASSQSIKLHAKTIPAGITIRVRYLSDAPRVTDNELDDGLLFPSGWEEIPALYAACRIKAVDQEDFSLLKTLLDEAIARMDQECDNLDIYQKVTTPGMISGGFWGDGHGENSV